MGRTQNIIGRVRGNLKSYGLTNNTIVTKELLDDLRQAVKKVYVLAMLEKKISVTLITDTDEYDLKLGDSIVSSVKAVIPPSTWNHKTINFVSLNKWNEIKKTIISGDYPIYGMIFSNKLNLHPAPGSGVNNDIITLLCGVTGTDAAIVLDAANDPDVPDLFDDALEYFVTAKNLPGKDKIEYLNLFQNEISANRPAIHRGSGIIKPRAF